MDLANASASVQELPAAGNVVAGNSAVVTICLPDVRFDIGPARKFDAVKTYMRMDGRCWKTTKMNKRTGHFVLDLAAVLYLCVGAYMDTAKQVKC